jgi:Ca2+-transporting ATPase
VQVIADGVLLSSFGLVVDEASLTGESEPIHKGEADPWCRSGTQVLHPARLMSWGTRATSL